MLQTQTEKKDMTSTEKPMRRLLTGENLDFLRSLDAESADLIITDPPFTRNKRGQSNMEALQNLASGKFEGRWLVGKEISPELEKQLHNDFPKIMILLESATESHGNSMGAFLGFLASRILEMRRTMKPTASIWLQCNLQATHYTKQLMDIIFGKQNFRGQIIWKYPPLGRKQKKLSHDHDIILLYSKSEEYIFNANALGASRSVWADVQHVEQKSQKYHPLERPVELYERMIRISSNTGDLVLDPFCGNSSALIAADRTRRQWIGIDSWPKARENLRKGLKQDPKCGSCRFSTRTRKSRQATAGNRNKLTKLSTKITMTQILIRKYGHQCQGCYHKFRDAKKLNRDHIRPKADEGSDMLENMTLLCLPCNQKKADTLTLTGLRKSNQENGKMNPRK